MILNENLIEEIKSEIELGYINKSKHPDLDLYMLNYSDKATIEWRWNDATKFCRGLIVDSTYNVINRSYYKFFDIEQIESSGCDDDWSLHSSEKYKIAHKKDGFLGVMYLNKPESYKVTTPSFKVGSKDMSIASRGSFTSDMAIRATEILHTKYENVLWDYRYTYVFEIIYPNGILTIHYGIEDIILHGIFDNETGEEIWIEDFKDYEYFKTMGLSMEEPVEEGIGFKGIEDFYSKYKFNDDEGYVISFESGYKIKVKFDEYKKMAHAKRSMEALYSKNFIKKVVSGEIDKILSENPFLRNEVRMTAVIDVKEFRLNLDESYHEKVAAVNRKLVAHEIEQSTKNFVKLAQFMSPKDSGMITSLYTGNTKYDRYLTEITIEHFAHKVT